jgi:predicted porin
LTFARRSTVSLISATLGELRVGRDFSPHYYIRVDYDPFNNNGVGASQPVTSSPAAATHRVSNSAAYWLPGDLGGVYGVAQYYLGENLSNAGATKKDGSGGGVRLGWRNPTVDLSLAHGLTHYATTATTGDIISTNIGGRYNMGAFSVMGGLYRDKTETIAGLKGRGAQIAGVWRVGAGEVKAMWSNYKTSAVGNPETKKLSLGYVHNLSKRTALYGTYARVRNSGGATFALNGAVTGANQSSSGFDVGIRHSF